MYIGIHFNIIFIDTDLRLFFLFIFSLLFLSVCTLKYMEFLSDRVSEDAGWLWVQGQPRSWLVDPTPGIPVVNSLIVVTNFLSTALWVVIFIFNIKSIYTYQLYPIESSYYNIIIIKVLV